MPVRACVQVGRVAECAGAHARGVRAGAADHRVHARAPRRRLAAARRARARVAGARSPRVLPHRAAQPGQRLHSRCAALLCFALRCVVSCPLPSLLSFSFLYYILLFHYSLTFSSLLIFSCCCTTVLTLFFSSNRSLYRYPLVRLFRLECSHSLRWNGMGGDEMEVRSRE